MTRRERAACMGYPVYPDLAAAAQIPVDISTDAAPRSSLGNAMHVACVGVVLAAAFASTEPV